MSGRRSKSIRLQEHLLRIFYQAETINRSVVLACCAMQLLWHLKLFCRRKQNQSSYFSTCRNERRTKIWTANKLLSILLNHVRSSEEILMKLGVDVNILKFATAIKRFAEPDFEGSCLIKCLSSFITTEPRNTRVLRVRSRWHQSKSCRSRLTCCHNKLRIGWCENYWWEIPVKFLMRINLNCVFVQEISDQILLLIVGFPISA